MNFVSVENFESSINTLITCYLSCQLKLQQAESIAISLQVLVGGGKDKFIVWAHK